MTDNKDFADALALARRVQLAEEAPAMLAALRTVSGKIGSYHDAETGDARGHIIADIELTVAAILARIDGAAPAPTAQPAGGDIGILRTVAGTDADWLAVTASRDNPGGAIGEAGGGVRTVRADHLAALVGAATSYAEDLASGLEDGTYSDRADLEAVNAAIAAVTGEA